MTVAVSRLTDAARVGDNELDAISDDDTEAFVSAEEWRFAGACSQAHLVIECGAKTMIALATDTVPPRSHNIDTLVGLLPDAERSLWAAFTADIDTAAFHQWRQGGTYTADLPIDGFEVDYLATVANVAINVAVHVTHRCATAGIDTTQIHLSTRSERRLHTALKGPLRVEADHPIRHLETIKDSRIDP